jgi:hypothetical protein
MIDELPDLIKDYPGASNCAQCFNHVVALVAIRVIRQFDIPSSKKDMIDEVEQELRELVEGLDIEEAIAQKEMMMKWTTTMSGLKRWITFQLLTMRSLMRVSGLSGCCSLK